MYVIYVVKLKQKYDINIRMKDIKEMQRSHYLTL